MKGEMTIEVLAMAIVAVITVATIYVMFTERSEPIQGSIPEISAECEIADDCAGNPSGHMCLRTGNPLPSRFCGCLTSSDCGLRTCGVDNKCH